ncbi:hypothetical protein IQ37_11545 [Chryseobacterium piperi]|uniref:Uncharacterized protein n=1 Tax=Chryseobacterium piperi TaxID=558152 RepID=A0A086BCL5_9FLAO|nr:hypothetical protein IQ37_11545 [Chryseobacterium piperi]
MHLAKRCIFYFTENPFPIFRFVNRNNSLVTGISLWMKKVRILIFNSHALMKNKNRLSIGIRIFDLTM